MWNESERVVLAGGTAGIQSSVIWISRKNTAELGFQISIRIDPAHFPKRRTHFGSVTMTPSLCRGLCFIFRRTEYRSFGCFVGRRQVKQAR